MDGRRHTKSTDGRAFERNPVPVLFDTTQLALERTIEGASRRHGALAANLANAETPGYQRVDVDFHGSLRSALAERDPVSRRHAVEGAGFTAAADGTGAMRADGSTVDTDAESARLAANALEHQAAVTVARARVDILTSAMGAR